jgi:hypothetical protein
MATVVNTGNNRVQRLRGGELRLGGRSGAFSLASRFAYCAINDCQAPRGQKKLDPKCRSSSCRNEKKVSRSLENTFYSIYIYFTLFPFSAFFPLSFLPLLFFYFSFTWTCFLLVFGFFCPEDVRLQEVTKFSQATQKGWLLLMIS